MNRLLCNLKGAVELWKQTSDFAKALALVFDFLKSRIS